MKNVTIIWHPFRPYTTIYGKRVLAGYAEQVDASGTVHFHSEVHVGLTSRVSTREKYRAKAVVCCLPLMREKR